MEYSIIPLQPVFHVEAIINIAYYRYAPSYNFVGESHNFWELVYVDHGSIVARAGDEKILLKASELIFHAPNEFHGVQTLGTSNTIVIAFVCNSPAMQQLVGKVLTLHQQERQCLQKLIEEASKTYAYFGKAKNGIDLQKAADAPWGSDQLIKTYLEQLFVYICRRDHTLSFSQRILSSSQQYQQLSLTQQLKDYLDEHYGEKLTLDSLASAMQVSVAQLKRVFRRQTGKTVMEYLTELRISEARRMIQQGEHNFTQIAQYVGYDSIYYFSSLFKKHTGMTLTEYSRSLSNR